MKYQEIFCCKAGFPPWPCFFCGEDVEDLGGHGSSRRGVVHHVDHDRSNNDPSNLEAAHYGCHTHHHLVKGNVGRKHTAESRKNMSESRTGKKLSATHAANIQAGIQQRSPCPDCGVEFNTVWMTRHRNEGHCLKS